MPVYTYECQQCGVRFEKFVRKMDNPAPLCNECGEETEQVPSTVSPFQWKNGVGWQ